MISIMPMPDSECDTSVVKSASNEADRERKIKIKVAMAVYGALFVFFCCLVLIVSFTIAVCLTR